MTGETLAPGVEGPALGDEDLAQIPAGLSHGAAV